MKIAPQHSQLTKSISLILITGLTACGSSEDRARAAEDMSHHHHDHHHHHDEKVNAEIEQGRLFISEKDSKTAHIYSLAQNKVIQTEELPNEISALYSSPNGKYALAINRKENLVNFYDSGLIVEDHGDHDHRYAKPVKKISLEINHTAPTHYEINNTQAGLFFDGIGNEGNPIDNPKVRAGFVTFSDADISKGVIPYQGLQTNMHGGVEARGDYAISSERLENSNSSLGDGVAIYHRHNDHFHKEQNIDTKCAGLHGSASSGDYSVFACSDGILNIYQKGTEFKAQKITYPDYFQSIPCGERSARIGAFANNVHQPFFVATACGQPQLIDPIKQEISKIVWTTDATRQVSSYAFDNSGNYLLMLDNSGSVTILDVKQNFKVINTLEVLSEPNRSRFINNPNTGEVYLLDENQKQIAVIDPKNASLKPAIKLDFTPKSITWFGYQKK